MKNDTEYNIFSIKQLLLHVLYTFPRFGESGFGETGLNQFREGQLPPTAPAAPATASRLCSESYVLMKQSVIVALGLPHDFYKFSRGCLQVTFGALLQRVVWCFRLSIPLVHSRCTMGYLHNSAWACPKTRWRTPCSSLSGFLTRHLATACVHSNHPTSSSE